MGLSLKDYANNKEIKNINEIELLNEDSLTSKALKFAIEAHGDTRRKDGILYINHPIAVANMVRENGYCDECIAAAYLHDVVEDTKYTLEDIAKAFTGKVAHLVDCASEPDKSLDWEDRKKHTINLIPNLSKEECIVPLCDKINNIEDLINGDNRYGDEFYSKFKRPKDYHEWYYFNLLNGFKKVYGYNNLVKRFAVDIAYLFLKNEELYDFNKNLEIPKRK